MKFNLTLIVLIACSSLAFGDSSQFTSKAAMRALAKYKEKIKNADKEYYHDLQIAKKSAMKGGDLEEANLIQKELERLKTRFISLEHGKPVEVSVNADRPKLTGVILKKGQKFSLEPNREDRWGGGGTKRGSLCNYMGYKDLGGKWMLMMYRVGKGEGVPVSSGELQVASQDGELTLYAFDSRPAGNSGKIRVSITISPK